MLRSSYFVQSFVVATALLPNHACAQEWLNLIPRDSSGRMSIFDAMATEMDSLLECRLYTDLGQLIRKRTVEAYQPAHIQFNLNAGKAMDGFIEIRARGKTRKEICMHPPIKAKWKKKSLDSLGFSDFNEMKVVLQCKMGTSYEQSVLREYLTYRLYNVISPYSFRVKLARFTLVDTRDTSRHFVKYGFFLEDADQLAKRLQGTLLDVPVINTLAFDREALLRFFVFQYMIGNTDWSFGNQHNVEMLKLHTGKVVPIGYDFDYAGLVASLYAVPHESLPIKSVKERYYKGIDCSSKEVQTLNDFFLAHKAAITTYSDRFPFLEKDVHKDINLYLKNFFDLLESKYGLAQVINTKE